MYADDVGLFTSTKRELSRALSLIKLFCRATAMNINTAKSRCTAVNGYPINFNLPFQQVTEDSLERYLGFTLSPQRLSPQTHIIIRKIATTLSLLRNKHFTEISKATILKYYLFSKLNHLFFCEPSQPQIYNTLNQVVGWFL